MKQFTVAIAGLGARGYDTYAKFQHKNQELMKITAIADIDPAKVKRAAQEFNIPTAKGFSSAEEMLEQGKLADCIFIATQDRQHINHTLKALHNGYDILLEKPVAGSIEDCLTILKTAKAKKRLVLVCHVLRYSIFYKTIKQIISEGGIGEPVTVNAIENVGYWHYAHSFTRGNWRKSSETSPMILQKCCHDFDIISWLLDLKCLSVSSFGSLKYFNDKNAPQGSSDYCYKCAVAKDCPYNAYEIYINSPLTGVAKNNKDWPVNIVCPEPTEENIREALKNGPYGKCVFKCDNNVVDHQTVNMLFENDVTAAFTMSGFTAKNCREIKIMGTLGEIVGKQDENIVIHTPFGKEPIIYDITKLTDDLSGHGGGDNAMLKQFFAALEDENFNASSTIENSIMSHIIAFSAEESRLNGGKIIKL